MAENVLRKHQRAHFVQVDYIAIRSDKLTMQAKGLLTYLMSFQEGWKFSIERIANDQENGTDAVKSALKELERKNYLKRTPLRTDKGTFDGYMYDISDCPMIEPSVENPLADKPPVENAPTNKNIVIKNTVSKNTEVSNSSSKEDSLSTSKKEKEEEINPSKKNPQNIVDYLLYDREIYTESLKQAIADWLEMRKKMRRPATDRAIELSIDDAIKYAKQSKCTPEEIFNQSTKNSWQGLFPLKESNKRTSMQRSGVRDIDHSEWDGVERLERI